MTIETRIVDPADPAVAALIAAHLAEMHAESPPESVHALDVAALSETSFSMVGAYDGGTLLGIGAISIGAEEAELKSMRTHPDHLRRGVASRILDALLAIAVERGVPTVALETGSGALFAPARALYARHGFVECGPFGDYRPDPLSTFMHRRLVP